MLVHVVLCTWAHFHVIQRSPAQVIIPSKTLGFYFAFLLAISGHRLTSTVAIKCQGDFLWSRLRCMIVLEAFECVASCEGPKNELRSPESFLWKWAESLEGGVHQSVIR